MPEPRLARRWPSRHGIAHRAITTSGARCTRRPTTRCARCSAAMGVDAGGRRRRSRGRSTAHERERWTRDAAARRSWSASRRSRRRLLMRLPADADARRARVARRGRGRATTSGRFACGELEAVERSHRRRHGARGAPLHARRRRCRRAITAWRCWSDGARMRGGAARRRAASAATGPRRCPTAAASGDRTLQLYAVRSERNWGIGDFTDLRRVVEQWGAARRGHRRRSIPLHALFPHNPAHASPYSPSSRLFLNPLYLDVEAIADFRECAAARELVRVGGVPARGSQRAARRASWSTTPASRRPSARCSSCCYAQLPRAAHAASARRRRAGRRVPRRSARQARRRGAAAARAVRGAAGALPRAPTRACWGWPAWPEAYRDPDAAAVRASPTSTRERVEFFEYLQWQADLQLAAARPARRGARPGRRRSTATSPCRSTAAAPRRGPTRRSTRSARASARRPTTSTLQGQDWGLPPLDPAAPARGAATRRSSRRCAPTCATRARCASTT